ncbi:TetR/AcrR family transcriptional regulator [Mesorhizobium sp. CN2-181]|uniref:TetR/AcrR family transcriptional regulator n=1 Tax=Mesorhizobium yinganensis TaxID=3157707 RepID=UPI0032B7FACA
MNDEKTVGPTSEADGSRQSLRAADRILDTARKLFYREGIRAIGVDEIVRQAGVTKPSLYRSFASKDDLAASYLKVYDQEFWKRFDAAVAAHPGDPRKQIFAFLSRVGERAVMEGYRGCGMTNAAVEYPEPNHPARAVGEANKRELRRRLREMAADMGAPDPDILGDGLLLLIEGAYISGQLFGPGGPAATVAQNADRLIEASLSRENTSHRQP